MNCYELLNVTENLKSSKNIEFFKQKIENEIDYIEKTYVRPLEFKKCSTITTDVLMHRDILPELKKRLDEITKCINTSTAKSRV